MLIGPKFKIARRLNSRVFPKTQTAKFNMSTMATGGKPDARRPKLSEYGQQLLEKQKARYTYLLKERTFSSYVKKVRENRKAGDNPIALLYVQLESRLDNVVYRLGLAPSRAAARQMVSHGHIVVNGRRLNIPSHQVKVGDKVAVRPESRNSGVGKGVRTTLPEGEGEKSGQARKVPSWLSYDEVAGEGKVLGMPILGENEGEINFGAILEFYSRV